MGKANQKPIIILILLTFIVCLISGSSIQAQELDPSFIHIRVLETTDLHANILNFDYKKREKTDAYGLVKTASLIKQARREVANSLLFDVGDALVGNELGKYAARKGFVKVHPVYKAMNLLHYDAGTVGNHEFNYGLDFLHQSLQGANFPIVNANIYIDDHNSNEMDDINYFNPYVIVEKEFVDFNGTKHALKVGVIGLITPIVAEWDRNYFKGKLKVKSVVDTAEHFVPIMKNKGADVIIALTHNGLKADLGVKNKEKNNLYSLSKVEGIDAILFGHTHSLFPTKDFIQGTEEMRIDKGKINEKPAVQAGYWGNHLGIIDLTLENINGKWKVITSKSTVKPIYRIINGEKKSLVNANPAILNVIKKAHLKTLQYLETKE